MWPSGKAGFALFFGLLKAVEGGGDSLVRFCLGPGEAGLVTIRSSNRATSTMRQSASTSVRR